MAERARVIAYVDGFNLYHGMRDSNLSHCLWLDIGALARLLLKPDQTLVVAKYFTAMISAPPADDAKRKRQSDYVEALQVMGVEIYRGQYLEKPQRCRTCGFTWIRYEEKMTDVQIATQLLTDAFEERFDVALVVSADSDLVPPVTMVRSKFRRKVVVCFPPKRRSHNLARSAGHTIELDESHLLKCQLADPVVKRDGYRIVRPASWRPK